MMCDRRTTTGFLHRLGGSLDISTDSLDCRPYRVTFTIPCRELTMYELNIMSNLPALARLKRICVAKRPP